MDNQRDAKEPAEESNPAAPEYVSVVIEWEGEAADIAAGMGGAPEDLMDEDKQVKEWDIVDEASAESFPASDAPARGSSRASTEPADRDQVERERVEVIETRRTWPWRELLGGAAAASAMALVWRGLESRGRRLRTC